MKHDITHLLYTCPEGYKLCEDLLLREVKELENIFLICPSGRMPVTSSYRRGLRSPADCTASSAVPRILKALWQTHRDAPLESRPYIKFYNIFMLFPCKAKTNILISFNLMLETEVTLIPTELRTYT